MLIPTLGAFPKPAYVSMSDWFQGKGGDYTSGYVEEISADGLDDILDRATAEVVSDQLAAGIDIPTDGEVRRENYIHYHCRHLNGIDFESLETVRMRDTAEASLPTIVGPITATDHFLQRDWTVAQAVSPVPVKITVPGPMTIADSVADQYYCDPVALGDDLAMALNSEIRALAAAGCTHIQVDEPVMARKPEQALAHGLADLERCFDDVPASVTRWVHACCGYPRHLDDHDYPKAPNSSYIELSEAIDATAIDIISIEDAHHHNDLGKLLPRFARTTVALGVVAIAASRIESTAEISARLRAALEHTDKLIAAPDCGLGFLGRELALTKLRNLALGAANVG